MRNLFLFLILAFFIFVFTFPAYAQQAQPTQPEIWISHSKPPPDLSVCSAQFNTCIALPFNDLSVGDYCGPDSEYFSNYPAGQGDCEDNTNWRSSTCYGCSCPGGQIRVDHICVPDQGCGYGIEDFVTGACYSAACPFGDGSAEACSHAPKCVVSENTTLIIDVHDVASCQCTGNKIWDSFEYTCHLPRCNGDFESPQGSVFDENSAVCVCPSQTIFDADTNSCVSTNCPTGQIFVGNTHQCEVAANCPAGYDIKAQDNSCYNPKSGTQICSNIDYDIKTWMHAVGPNDCVFAPHELVTNLVFPCLFINSAVQNQIDNEYDNIQACNACASPNFVDIVFDPGLGSGYPYRYSARCLTPETFCNTRGGIWRSDLNHCVDGMLQPSIPPRASSSSHSSAVSSSAQSSSVFSSFSSSSAASNTGGSGGSSGSNNSTGGGGDGGNNGDGSGGGTGSSGSVASVVNSSAVASIASSVSNSVNSVAHSTVASSGNGSSVTGSNGSNTSSGSGASSGSNNSSGSGTGGTGGGGENCQGAGGCGGAGGSSGNNGSTASQGNSSAHSSGPCNPEAEDYLDCIGKNKKPFPNHATADSGSTTFDQVNGKFFDRLKQSPIINSFSAVSHVMVEGDSTCPVFSIDLTDTIIGVVVSTTIHCDLMTLISSIISVVMMIVWTVVAFKIFASA